jgi:hypothetical protein
MPPLLRLWERESEQLSHWPGHSVWQSSKIAASELFEGNMLPPSWRRSGESRM